MPAYRTMMRAWVFTLVLAGLIGETVPVYSAEQRNGFYIGARAIGAYAIMEDLDNSGFIGPPKRTETNDTVAGIAALLGYSFGSVPIRAELEVGHRYRFDLSNDDLGPPSIVDYESNVGTTSVLMNVVFEWRSASNFTPYLGGTIGWSRNSNETERTVRVTQATEFNTRHEDNVAWGVTLGVDWAFAVHWSAGVSYRFIHLGDVDTGDFSGGESVSTDSYTSHDILLSLYYRF